MQFAAFSDSAPGVSSQEVFDVQTKLKKLGFTIDVSGSYDGATSAAVLGFREKAKLQMVDRIDAELLAALDRVPTDGVPPMALALGASAAVALAYWWATR